LRASIVQKAADHLEPLLDGRRIPRGRQADA
jgi:hypothetical protein